MLSRIQQTLTKLPAKKNVLGEPSRVTSGSQAAKDLAADGNGKHVHLFEETCIKSDCEKKTCPTLCDNLDTIQTKGHFTHGPKAGKFSKQLSDLDANGAKKGQYYTKNCDKHKKVSGQKPVSYKTNKEIKLDAKMQQYLQKPEIADKFKNS